MTIGRFRRVFRRIIADLRYWGGATIISALSCSMPRIVNWQSEFQHSAKQRNQIETFDEIENRSQTRYTQHLFLPRPVYYKKGAFIVEKTLNNSPITKSWQPPMIQVKGSFHFTCDSETKIKKYHFAFNLLCAYL